MIIIIDNFNSIILMSGITIYLTIKFIKNAKNKKKNIL
jgi:hypothetical protein